MRFTLTCLWVCFCAASAVSDEPLLQPNDRIAILGGTFVERMQASGDFEAELQCRRPEWKLSFRNIGWSGDDVHGIGRKRFDGPEDGFQRILRDVETANANRRAGYLWLCGSIRRQTSGRSVWTGTEAALGRVGEAKATCDSADSGCDARISGPWLRPVD